MIGLDPILILAALLGLALAFLALDFVFSGGGMASAMMGGAAQCGTALMGSPYGWMLIVAVVVIALGVFGILFR